MSVNLVKKRLKRIKRKGHIRKTLSGTTARPRLTVFRTAKHMYAQVVDDETNRTMAAVSTLSKTFREQLAAAGGKMKKVEQAKAIGKAIAEACKGKGIGAVVFDRNGFRYHGRVAAVAAAAREAGLRF